MGVAGYINTAEEFGHSGLLFFVMMARFEEQRMGKRRLHVTMRVKDDEGAIELE